MRKIVSLIVVFILVGCNHVNFGGETSERWMLNSTTTIGERKVTPEGNPQVKKEQGCASIFFDGDGDRLLLKGSPLKNAESFTIEALIKPYDVFPANKEPRFLHIESPENPLRRFTFELRLNDKHQWYLDAYIKSEKSQFTLIDATKTHPTGVWAHVAVTYANGVFTSYVNGIKELEGKVDYQVIPENADISVGARLNQIHWFNGEIAEIRFSKHALMPKDFSGIPK